LLKGEVRETLAVAVDEAILQSEMLFAMLEQHSQAVVGSDRKEIFYDQELIDEVNKFKASIDLVEEELVFEAGLFTLEPYQLRIAEEHLEMIQLSLELFNSKQIISWLMEDREGTTLVIMPRTVKEVLREHVFSHQMPVVFSSATLSVNGTFKYAAESLGIEQYLSFSVPSPFDYANHMQCIVPRIEGERLHNKMVTAVQLLQRTEGRALILFSSREELKQFKEHIFAYKETADMRFFFEGDREISHLISLFQNDEQSILCAVTLWEGLDIPGPSLSNVIIWSLPFPPQDPVFAAKRQASQAPFEEVDMPYMLLRLKQGIGRLIRTREDAGIICILGQEIHHNPSVKDQVKLLLPQDVNWIEPTEETVMHSD
jgi:ATP-dependent DNA helicase DinG